MGQAKAVECDAPDLIDTVMIQERLVQIWTKRFLWL